LKDFSTFFDIEIPGVKVEENNEETIKILNDPIMTGHNRRVVAELAKNEVKSWIYCHEEKKKSFSELKNILTICQERLTHEAIEELNEYCIIVLTTIKTVLYRMFCTQKKQINIIGDLRKKQTKAFKQFLSKFRSQNDDESEFQSSNDDKDY
jgi:hypothetical protein